jgi:hypothetical protein
VKDKAENLLASQTPTRQEGYSPSGLGERAGSPAAGRLPREAREGIMRAWIEILKQRHPGVTWIAQEASFESH